MSIDFNENFRADNFVDVPDTSDSTGASGNGVIARGLIPQVVPVAQTGSSSISLTAFGSTYQQNFDSLANTAGSTTNTALPLGWYITEQGGGARDNEQYAVDTGGSGTGDIYSYGAAASTDRAIGQLRSGTLIPFIGAQFTNNTGGAIGSLDIAYTGEQWRLGTVRTGGAVDKMDFQISFNATAADDDAATWVDINSLDFSTVDNSSTGAKNGNAAGDQSALSTTYTLANALANGASFWIRWQDTDATGADDGLAIDDFSLTAHQAAAGGNPGVLTVADTSVVEGNGIGGDGPDMVFTVTRSDGSTGAIDVGFTLFNGTTSSGDFDTGTVSVGTVHFADGATTAQIHVPIFPDTNYEPDETFTVQLSNPTGGATLGAHSTATGTIINDDAPPAGTLSIADASLAEGDSGTSDMVFNVSRAGGSTGAVDATWTISFGSGGAAADASDLGAGTPLTGTVHFDAGATTAQIHVPIQGDMTFEANQTFTVTLTNPTGGATLTDAVATGTITNDDTAPPTNVFINEIHYDDASADSNEGIEIAGLAGTDLTGWHIVLYNGNGGTVYAPTGGTTAGVALSGFIPDQQNGYGTVSVLVPGLQNGGDAATAPQADGFALVDNNGVVVQFLSYEGVMTATNGPAAGLTSTDIGVSEDPAPADGLSLQLTGAGSTAGDFTWVSAVTQSYGAINAGQSFLSATGTSHLRVDDASVSEGNSGTTNLTFTVHRAGGQNAATSVGYTINLDGTADSSDLGVGAVLNGTVSFGIGEFTKTITVPVQGDAVGEPNETLHVSLGAPTGDAVVDRATATGTIVNDDPIQLLIGEIQGAGHTSSVNGQLVLTSGIVTAVASNGFYLQDAGDGNSATSDGIFVFTSTAPTVVVGDAVDVSATVQEFQGDAAGLTVTELTSATVTLAAVNPHGNALPAAVIIGEHGILPPSHVIEDDGLTTYDPAHDGIDFWESLEGMRVTIETPQAVSNTNSFGETDVVASHGAGASGMNDRGGITISPNGDGTVDYNPEKIQIDDDSTIFSGFTPNYTIGDQMSDITGILNYSHDNYEVLVTGAVTTTLDNNVTREVTTLHGDATHLSLATYNLENLDASDNKYTILATDMMVNLGAPDIIAVQEVQDADGAGGGADLSGVSNAQGIIDAIFTLTGKHYAYIEIAPTVGGSTGGEPGGNIRNGYLYNIDRVTPDGSPELITGAAYTGSRNPLVQSWTFNGQHFTTIDVHSTSRGGSDELWGDNQPPTDAGDGARTAQAAGVKAWINDHLATDPNMNIAVLGDWNGFYFEQAQTQLTDPLQGGVLTNLNTLLTPEERYSYLFDGNAQQIDNILVTGGLLAGAQYDSVHINSQFAATNRPTDHDPQVSVLNFATAQANDDSNSTAANASASGSVLTNDDANGTTLTVTAVNGSTVAVGQQITLPSGALLTLNADGAYSYNPGTSFDYLTAATGAANSSATDTFTYAVNGGDTATVTITVTGVANAGDQAQGTTGNDTITGTGGNDVFLLNGGGTDHATGGAGNDGFYFGGAFDPTDVVDGGDGTMDQIGLQGDYSGGVTFGPTSMTDVEMLVFLSGSDTRFGDTAGNHYSYDVTTDDANVGAGQTLVVQANALGSGENLTFDGSAEQDGSFSFFGGQSNDDLTGGQKDDSFYFGIDGRFGAGDTVDGQGGSDQLRLQGDYSGGNAVVLGVDQVKSVDLILLASAADTRFGAAAGLSYSYDLTTDDSTVAAGETMTIQAKRLAAGESLHFDGSNETDGAFKVYAGAGDDVIVGGAKADYVIAGAGSDHITGGGGADNLFGGDGNDTFFYTALTDSNAAGMDRILDFAAGDTIDLSALPLNNFIGAAEFGHHAGEVRVSQVGSYWQIDGDTDGDGIADLSIQVEAAGHAWSGSDFVLAPAGIHAGATTPTFTDLTAGPDSSAHGLVRDAGLDIGHASALPVLASLAELHIV